MTSIPAHIYFIQEHLHRQPRHGGIGNTDMEKIFVQLGYQPIVFPGLHSHSVVTKLTRVFFLVRILFSIPSGSVVLFQHPLYAGVHRLLIKWLLSVRKVTIICIVLDIDGVRDEDAALMKKELALFNRMNGLIVHNESMAEWLSKNGVNRPYTCLDFFDFLSPEVAVKRVKAPLIAYAGNLERAGFIHSLHELGSLRFNIYGEPAVNLPGNTSYKGSFEPYEMAGRLEGAFGLVWNGDRIDSLKGDYQDYLSLISPHKLSQYIVAGMPVIAPEHSAAARLVQQLNIGFTIRSLTEIPEKLATLSDRDYGQFVENCQRIAGRIRTGDCISTAINTLLSKDIYE